jgi:excisionase family DNA binding protein
MPTTSVVAPKGAERRRVAAVEEFLGRHPQDDGSGAAKLVSPDGDEVEVPAQLLNALRQIARSLAQGDDVMVGSVSRELSTGEAARALGMSRPTLVRLLDAGELPSRKVGSHRRVLTADVLAFRRHQMRQRRKAYEDLMLASDALGLDEGG